MLYSVRLSRLFFPTMASDSKTKKTTVFGSISKAAYSKGKVSLVPRPHPLREKGPGIHCLRMRLISQHSAAPAYHRVMSAVWWRQYVYTAVLSIVYAIMATRVEDLDRSISYALQPLQCAARTPKPEQRTSLKSVYEGKDVFGCFCGFMFDPPSE